MLAVALGASIGAVLRWAAGVWMNSIWHGFPLGTLLVNCAGGNVRRRHWANLAAQGALLGTAVQKSTTVAAG